MALTLYPAIDLKGGQVVRLRRGDMAQATVYSGEPGAQARKFAATGFSWLHVVDLDGAFAGRPANAAAVEAILEAVPGLPVQLGGGIRSMATVEAWLSRGVQRVILGSAALKDPEFARAACRAHPGRIAVGIDARKGMVAVEGWAQVSTMPAEDLARRFEDAGAAAIIYTDIDRDGMLGGVNLEQTLALARAVASRKRLLPARAAHRGRARSCARRDRQRAAYSRMQGPLTCQGSSLPTRMSP
jgi:phosphoribosylformimino-5-aminoimidazole carboxamide ribotide isomerase